MKLNNLVVLLEGGGDIIHPYDLESVDSFVKFWDEFFAGDLTTTEKVDGYNLLIGLNKDKRIIYKSRKQHGSRAAFISGFKIIKTKLEQLSNKELYHYRLINEKGKPLNFINTEIVYGEQSSSMSYSQIINYIVFHTYSGTEDNGYKISDDLTSKDGKELLTQLANKLNKNQDIPWEFKGPIIFSRDQIFNQIPKNIVSVWERKKLELLQFRSNDNSKKEMVKNISKELSNIILSNIKSKLPDNDTKVKKGFQGIEGLTINYKDNLVKITRDFAAPNIETVKPANFLANLKELVANDILKLKLKKIDKKSIERYSNVTNLLVSRNKEMDYNTQIERKNEILGEAGKVIRALKDLKTANSSISFAEKLVNSYIVDLQNFMRDVERASTLKQLAVAFFENLFWKKNRHLSEKTIFDKMKNELH